MAVYQDKAKDRVRTTLPKMRRIIDRGIENNIKEADTRQVVTRVVSDMLGWDEFDNLTAEQAISGGFADFVIQKENSKNEMEKLAVIEVKSLGTKLNENHLRQARGYAMDEGIEFILLTNGNSWQAYHVAFIKNAAPEVTHIFTVKITDPEMKPADKADLFYLLTEEAWRKCELKDYAERNLALSGPSLAEHILSNEVLDRVRLAIKKKSGHVIPNNEIAEMIIDGVFCNEVVPDNQDAILRKLKGPVTRKRSVAASPDEKKEVVHTLVCISK